MGLRDTAHGDLQEILADTVDGGESITITSPASVSESFYAFTNDIHFAVDPETGQTVTSRQCTASVLISALIDVGFDAIKGVVDSDELPWVVTTTDANGVVGTFKVSETFPDNGAGLMVLFLEGYTTL